MRAVAVAVAAAVAAEVGALDRVGAALGDAARHSGTGNTPSPPEQNASEYRSSAGPPQPGSSVATFKNHRTDSFTGSDAGCGARGSAVTAGAEPAAHI
jgi:hypothetical protein